MTLTELLKIAVANEASDLYLIPESPPVMRVEEEMLPIGERTLTPEETQRVASIITTDSQEATFKEEQELDFAYEDEDIGRFRVNLYRSHNGTAMVCRLVRPRIPSVEELNLPAILKDLVMEERGLILVVGAVGSGKSSTLAALLDHRNMSRTGHILTVEDPLEYLHSHKRSLISQREVGIDTESYHNALKKVLRQAPDVIVIGEIRDTETMSAAIHFAETGHLLLSTLHATNVQQALDRVINFFPRESRHNILLQLSMNLKAIVSQRLIPKADGTGLVPAVGVMIDTPRVKDLISKEDIGAIVQAIEDRNKEGMISLDQSIFNLYEQGIVTAEDALRFADSPNNVGIKVRRLENTRRQQQESDRLRRNLESSDRFSVPSQR